MKRLIGEIPTPLQFPIAEESYYRGLFRLDLLYVITRESFCFQACL